MKKSSEISSNLLLASGEEAGRIFVTTATAAIRRAAKQVKRENHRLGLPLIVETAGTRKRIRSVK